MTCRSATLAALMTASTLAMLMPGGMAPAQTRPAPATPAPAPDDAPNDAAVRARADALIARMTPEEKAGQLTQYFYFARSGAVAASIDAAIAAGRAGSALFVSDPATANRLQRIAMERSRLKIPLLMGFDVIHGLRTIMPVPLGMAASWDPALVERAQAAAAAEARAVGIHWVFAPNLDIARDPRWGRIVEGAGEDPYLGAAMARAQVRGFQGARIGSPGHVIAGPKHFAAYGASIGGRDYDEVQVSDSELWNVYLPPFKAAVEAGAGNIMSAYMPINGVPAAGNRWLLTDVLRDTWEFKGFVVSDAAAVHSLGVQGFARDDTDAAVRAIGAGLDMEMAPPGGAAAMDGLPAAMAAGRVPVAQVDDAVRRVLIAKIRMGLFEHPYVDAAQAERVLDDPGHRAIARVAAERSAVLLRNDGDLLPLDHKALRSIALIGPLADAERDTLGSWVFAANRPRAVTLAAGLRARLGAGVRIDQVEGARMPTRIVPSPFAAFEQSVARPPVDEAAEIARAVAAARGADVAILALGEAQDMSGEAASRSTLALPGRQQALLDAVVATGKPVVVVLFGARPFDLKGTRAAAILDMWYPGSEGGTAIANLLFGDATPGGKLPITWIADIADAPSTYAHLQSHDVKNADERFWDRASSAPTYPFGHGLSYTRFAYANIAVSRATATAGDTVTVTAQVRNLGRRTGDEVAQLYLHQRYGTDARPVRQLKGFERITLKPGETRTVRFAITPDDRRYWSAATRGWVADATTFDVWVGGDSQATLAGSFAITR